MVDNPNVASNNENGMGTKESQESVVKSSFPVQILSGPNVNLSIGVNGLSDPILREDLK